MAANEGYSGSSKDHYYHSLGVTSEASCLKHQERSCGYQSCLKLMEGCLLAPANQCQRVGITPRTTEVALNSARQSPEARHTRNSRNPLPEFCNKLSMGQNIIVWVANNERLDNPDKDYCVVKTEGWATKLEEGGPRSAEH